MRIKSVTLSNFKKQSGLTFKPDSDKTVVAFVGKNGSGKTTMQEAIQYAITGICPDNAIKLGESEMSVDCLLDDGNYFTRGKRTTGSFQSLNGHKVTGVRLKEYIEDRCDTTTDALKLSISANVVDNMKPEQLSDFLSKHTPDELTADRVAMHSESTDPKVIDFLKSLFPSGEFGTAKVEAVYNELVESRKNHKRILTEKKNIINSILFERPAESLESVQKKLEQVIKDEGAAEALKTAIKTYEKIVEGRKKQEALIKKLEDDIAKSTATRPKPAKLESIFDRRKETNKKLIDAKSSIQAMNLQIKSLTDLIPRLDSCMCPLSESITCKSVSERKVLKKEYEDEIKAHQEGIKLKEKEIEMLNADMTSLEKEEKAYRSNEKDYQALINLRKELDNAKSSLPTLPKMPEIVDPDTRDFAEEKRQLNELKAKILKCDERDKLEAEYKDLSQKWNLENTCVSLLAPKGTVMDNIMEEYLEEFENICNDQAEKMRPGFKLKFVQDNGVKVYCETEPGKGFIPYESVSSGEKAYVLLLLMDMINAITQVNIIMIDDLDKLDNEAFDALLGLLTDPDVEGVYDHIFINAVNHTDTLDILKKYPTVQVEEM